MKVIQAAALLLFCGLLSAAEVPNEASQVHPLLPGSDAPAFTAVNAYGESFDFDPKALERPAVLIFYRGGWCPYCNLYWAELRKVEAELMALDLDLMFLSADSPETLADAVADETDRPAYHLLSDGSSEIAQAFGIAFRASDKTYNRYLEMDLVDLEKASGYDHHYLPVPAVFIIGTDGVVAFQYVNPNYKVTLAPQVLLAAVANLPEFHIKRPGK
jgi:peroxiredoxin